MVNQYSSDKGDQHLGTDEPSVHPSQINYGRPTRNVVLPEEAESFISDLDTDDVPPPAYGDVYGEIHNEKDGIDTRARVSDDGRVDIHINGLNRRLSQIFTPILHQQNQSAEDDRPPASPYIPASLGGTAGVPAPPLNIVIQVVGSRGDVQPFVALGKVLKETCGHRVRLATHPNFQKFVEENGLEFFSIGGDPSRLMAFMVKNPNLMPSFRSIVSGDISQRRKDVAEYIQGCWRSCYKAGNGMPSRATLDDKSSSETEPRPFVADCIIANPPSFAHIHCAEKLGIPLHIMFTMPYSPTQSFPHPLANIRSSDADAQLTNYISYAMIELLTWQGLSSIINRFRARCLGLDPISVVWAPGMLQRLRIPHTYCWSPALIPKPKDWGNHIDISGFYFLNLSSSYTPAPELQAFLDAGPPPVYIGFGSIVLEDPNAMTELIFEAVKKTGQRCLLSKGWGGMGADGLTVPEGVFMLGNVPHDWLFKHVSCVVHHGGAGTTSAGLTAGRPTFIVPFFGDQPFWGSMVARAGAGPEPIPHKRLTADNLADAITFCLSPSVLARAELLASTIAQEKGCEAGAQSFHRHLQSDRLRCLLAPERVAVWRVRRTQVRLSGFAVCALVQAGLLEFNELKLFRAQEYEPDEGPSDPISGGFTAACRAFAGMAKGLADTPGETVRAFTGSSDGKAKSQISVAEGAGKEKHSQINLTADVSSATAENSQTSTVGVGEGSSSSSKPSLLRGQTSLSSNTTQETDMMRQSPAHARKGMGGFATALARSPMEISVSLTKGMHNLPRLWNDDTMRPQERVVDFRSGMRAMGKEFGYGMYDGVTGVITQPWRGAQKEGAVGFAKGVGKGLGGFVAKSGAGMLGVLSYPMKGVQKELQKLVFANDVQGYIAASRTALGYEELGKATKAEKEDVIVRWNMIQKYLKKKHNVEMMQDMLDAQRKSAGEERGVCRDSGDGVGSVESGIAFKTPAQGVESAAGTSTDTPDRGVESTAGTSANTSVQVVESAPFTTSEPRASVDDPDLAEALRLSTLPASSQVPQQHDPSPDYDTQLAQALALSLLETTANSSTHESPAHNQPPPLDSHHVTGTTRTEFEAQQQQQRGNEKTTEELREEEIVLQYVKKQSLLEARLRGDAGAEAGPSSK